MGLLYLTSYFPKRSETFVYREVLGLRQLGIRIVTASLHEPGVFDGESDLQSLAKETITLYTSGMAKLAGDALSFFLSHPYAALCTLATALGDFLTASDARPADRAKIPVQAMASLALAWRLRRHPISGVHVHMAHAPATVGMYLSRALGIPMSFTGHAVDLFRDRCLLSQKLQRAAFVACISLWHRNWYRTIIPGDESKYPVIRCGVEVPQETPAQRDDALLRILGLARLVPKKGFDTLLHALSDVHRHGVPFECLIAGDGPERVGLEELALSLGLSEKVRFLGSVSHANVPDLLSAADVMILPCKQDATGDRDGIPVALMEAMARGIPVISGDLPTIRELIHNRISGLLVPPGDSQALSLSIREIASNPSLRARLGGAGRERIKEEFASEGNLVRLLNSLSEHHML